MSSTTFSADALGRWRTAWSSAGTSLRPDDDATEQVYGRKISARAIVTGTATSTPASGQALLDVLQKRAPYNQSGKSAAR